jgi:hypothetical protein
LRVPVVRVGFQQRIAGYELDDVVLHGISGEGADLTVEYQSKRTISPVSSNTEFHEVIESCLRSIGNDPHGFERKHRRLGLAAAEPVIQLRQLQRVVNVAAAHDDEASFRALFVEGTTDADVRRRYGHLRSTVADVLKSLDGTPVDDADVDQATWWVAHNLEVWIAEVEGTGRDVANAVSRLGQQTGNREGALALFETLVSLAETWGPEAGTVSLSMLRAEVERHGVRLGPGWAQAAAFEAARASTVRSFSVYDDKIAGQLHLPRTPLKETISEAAVSATATLVTGKAGAGKSALMSIVASALSKGAAVVVAIGLSPGITVSEVETRLGCRIVDCLFGAPIGLPRVLVIDGAEQSLSDGGQVLTHVLAAMPDGRNGPSWQLLITARDEAAEAINGVVSLILGRPPISLRVGDLTDDEVEEVVLAFPHLARLASHARAAELLLRRPYLASLVARYGQDGRADNLTGEEDIIDLFTERVIRRDNGARVGRGNPAARTDVFLALADAQLQGLLPAQLAGRDGEAIEGLLSDDVIIRDRLSYQFAHDVLADYAEAVRLLEPGGLEHLRTTPEPRRIVRGVRLWMQHQLAANATDPTGAAACFDGLIEVAAELAYRDGSRWEDLPYEAVLSVGSSASLLAVLEELLLADDGHHLERLLSITRRVGHPAQ